MAPYWFLAATTDTAQRLAREAGLSGASALGLSWAELTGRWPEAPDVRFVLVDWSADPGVAVRSLATLRHLTDAEVWAVAPDAAAGQAAVDTGVTTTLRRPLQRAGIQRALEHLLRLPDVDSDAAAPAVLAAREWRFTRLARLHRDLTAAPALEGVADILTEGAADLLGAVSVVRVLRPGDGAELIRGWGEWLGSDLQRITGVMAVDALTDVRVAGCDLTARAGGERASGVGHRTALVPVVSGAGPVALILLRRDARPFNFKELACAELLASQAGGPLAQRLQATSMEGRMVRMLMRALHDRDPQTHAHSRRAAAVTEALLKELGLDPAIPEYAETLRGALLHDVGKIGVPETPCLSPGR